MNIKTKALFHAVFYVSLLAAFIWSSKLCSPNRPELASNDGYLLSHMEICRSNAMYNAETERLNREILILKANLLRVIASTVTNKIRIIVDENTEIEFPAHTFK